MEYINFFLAMFFTACYVGVMVSYIIKDRDATKADPVGIVITMLIIFWTLTFYLHHQH